MDGYCLRTRLQEKPCVFLYYKGMEDDKAVFNALDAVVGFSPNDTQVLDEDAAKSLCMRLNEDCKVLAAHGYTEFEVIKKANGV